MLMGQPDALAHTYADVAKPNRSGARNGPPVLQFTIEWTSQLCMNEHQGSGRHNSPPIPPRAEVPEEEWPYL